MLKKILLFVFIFITPVYGAQIVNVEYIHRLIKQVHDIDISYNAQLRSEKQAANMKYLLTAIDVANQKLNGRKTSNHGTGSFATTQAADTVATIQAVRTLVKKSEPGFYFVPATSDFSFDISAAGNFKIDWGDGTSQTIDKANTTNTTYSHTYDSNYANYTAKLTGLATRYSSTHAAISFKASYDIFWQKISSIDGCLGCIFPTLADGAQPRFNSTFSSNRYITSIPANLFSELDDAGECVRGVCGAPVSDMFSDTFYNLVSLTSIPDGLFAGIVGPPAERMFFGTFWASAITSIPDGLFAGIVGPPAEGMFGSTFSESSLTSIPDGLFAGIVGPPAEFMFDNTFGATAITSIPENLFGDIRGAAQNNMFSGMFGWCFLLTGSSARIGDKYLYEIWPDATVEHVGGMYSEDTGLDDYNDIPDAWKSW